MIWSMSCVQPLRLDPAIDSHVTRRTVALLRENIRTQAWSLNGSQILYALYAHVAATMSRFTKNLPGIYIKTTSKPDFQTGKGTRSEVPKLTKKPASKHC